MPLLEVQHIKKVTAAVQLEESVAVATDKYAAFIRASADDVINKALEYVFAKDKDFQKFLASDASRNPVPHSLQVRESRAPGKDPRTSKHPVAVAMKA
jgi:hypothetical protein